MKTMKGRIAMMGIVVLTCLAMSAWAQKKEDAKVEKGHDRGHRHHGKHGGRDSYKNSTVADRVYRITQADSIQAKKMKPVVDKASDRMKALRADYQKKEKIVMDSLKLQLKLLLKEEQNKKLDEFNDRKGNHRWH
jgi:hypothetical protein